MIHILIEMVTAGIRSVQALIKVPAYKRGSGEKLISLGPPFGKDLRKGLEIQQ